MKWRNPENEMPKQNQMVWIMLEPHKDRDTLQESAASIEIVAGEVCYDYGKKHCRVENFDELGRGSVSWYLGELPEDFLYDESYGIAWLPVEEMIYPNWRK